VKGVLVNKTVRTSGYLGLNGKETETERKRISGKRRSWESGVIPIAVLRLELSSMKEWMGDESCFH
jgi:hypothetical protein